MPPYFCTMKSTPVYTLLFLFSCTGLFSQSSKYDFGIQTYAGISGLEYQNPVNRTYETFIQENSTIRFSPGLMALVQYHISSKFLLQANLGYKLSGYRVKELELYYTTPDKPEGDYLGKAKGRLNYHDLTLGVHAKAKPVANAQGFYIVGGVSSFFNIGRSKTIFLTSINGDHSKTTEKLAGVDQKITPINFSGDLGVGYEFKAFEQSRFFVEPIFNITLLPVYKELQGKYGQFTMGIQLGLVW